MRKQIPVPTEGAEPGDGDALGRDPSGIGLLGQHLSYIDGSGVGRGLHSERTEYLRADFITRSADGRTQVYEKASRVGPPPLTEKRDSTGKDTRRGSPPSGVQERDRPCVRIQ
jgi:hypothetical protein